MPPRCAGVESPVTRRFLAGMEWLAAKCAHRVICVSESLRRIYIEMGLAAPNTLCVIGAGSSNGIDAERFAASPERRDQADRLRAALGIPMESPVIGFVGRVNRDKGISELLHAFRHVQSRCPNARLLVVGDIEQENAIPNERKDSLQSDPSIICTGFVPDPESYYHLMDVLAFPSFREGFPNVPLQAAAAGVPVAGFRATGTVDAVLDGVTGTLVAKGDSVALANAIHRYICDPSLRARHGSAGRKRVLQDFQPQHIWEALYHQYASLLTERGLGMPNIVRSETETRESSCSHDAEVKQL